MVEMETNIKCRCNIQTMAVVIRKPTHMFLHGK